MIALKFQAANHLFELRRWAAVANIALGDAIREEMRLVLAECIRRTPPFSGADLRKMVGSDIQGSARAVGEKAVERDVRKVFRPVSGLRLFSENRGFRDAVFEGNEKVVNRFLAGSSNYNGIAKAPDASVMLANRIRRGRVGRFPHWRATLTSLPGQMMSAEKKPDVGRAKAGWVPAARLFGLKVPAWISRHAEPGEAFDGTRRTSGRVFATAGNLVRFIQEAGRDLRIIQIALQSREKSLMAKIRRAISGAKP